MKNKIKHTKKIIFTIISIILVPLCAFIGIVNVLLPPKSQLAQIVAACNKLDLDYPECWYNWVTSGERDYSTLPEILTLNNGSVVTSIEQYDTRKEEMLDLFNTYVYGDIPKTGFETSFDVIKECEILNGQAIRKQIKITVTTAKGSNDALMLMYLPKSEQPVGMVIGHNFKGNHTVSYEEDIINSYALEKDKTTIEEERGLKSSRWPIEQIIASGNGVATMYYGDWAPDSKKTYNTRIISLFEDENFRAISAWAFGIMRGVDYLVQDEDIDNTKIASIGHSRLGKTSLWAGANDPRISLVITNGSGNTGASLSRDNHGETVKYITFAFPHWFIDSYSEYGNNENNLPLDQHMLLALVAPRKLYVGNAREDLWADPIGSFNALQFSKKAYEIYNLNTIPDMDNQLKVNEPLYSECMAYHLREGGHDITPVDWEYYLYYMNNY